jgi:pilus assembly protein FimV
MLVYFSSKITKQGGMVREYTLKKWLLAACSIALVMPIAASAAGLGRLIVLSALGQPLNAEVELVNAQKGETLTARLSSIDTYTQANITYNAALVGARVTVERRPNGQAFLRVTTPRPVNEPFADLLIEINSENGKVTRQYTVLLDPPGYGRAAGEIPPPTVAAAPAARSAPLETRALPPQDAAPSPSPSAAAAPGASTEAGVPGRAAASRAAPAARSRSRGGESAAATEAGAKQYGPVKRGETLGGIARNVKPDGATLEQTLVSLYRQNPDAFIKKNMNLVKSGRILNVPEANEMVALSHKEAAQEVRLQVADFNSFRGRIADRAADAPEQGSTTSGKIGARVVGPPAGESRDTVRLSRSESGAKGGKGGTERLRALEEEAVAREKALADANERIGALEKTIKDLQRRADLQGTAAAGKATASQASAAPAAKADTPAVIAVAPVLPPPAKAPAAPAAQPPQPDVAQAVPDAAKGTAPDAGKAIPPDAGQAVPEPNAPVADTKAAPPATAKAPAPGPGQDRDLLETVMDEPVYLAGAIGGVVLIGGLGLVAARRRRAAGNGARVKIAPTLSSESTASSGATASRSPTASRSATASSSAITDQSTGAAASSGAASSSEGKTTPPPGFGRASPPEPMRAAPSAATGGAAAVPGAGAGTTAATPSPAAAASADNDLDFGAASRAAGSSPANRPAPAAALRTASPPGRTETPLAKPEPPLKVSAPAATADSVLNDGPLGRRLDPTAPAGARTAPTQPATPPAPPAVPPAVPPAAPKAAPAPAPAAKDASLPDFSLNVPPVSTPSAETPTAREPAPLDFNMDFNLEPLPPIDTPTDPKAAAMAKATADTTDLDFKLGDLNLNFGGTPAAAPEAKDDHWYDVQQKFDLAKAYEEMGDKGGARDILQEVVKEGDPEQQAHAKKLLGSLG